MFLGDSRTMEGPGLIPAQDHRPQIGADARALRIAVRIIDRRPASDLAAHVQDEEIAGDIQGLAVWRQEGTRRPMAVWRHAYPCVVLLRGSGIDGPVTPSGDTGWGPTTPSSNGVDMLGATTYSGGEIPADSRPILSWQHQSLADYISGLVMGGGYNQGWGP